MHQKIYKGLSSNTMPFLAVKMTNLTPMAEYDLHKTRFASLLKMRILELRPFVRRGGSQL